MVRKKIDKIGRFLEKKVPQAKVVKSTRVAQAIKTVNRAMVKPRERPKPNILKSKGVFLK